MLQPFLPDCNYFPSLWFSTKQQTSYHCNHSYQENVAAEHSETLLLLHNKAQDVNMLERKMKTFSAANVLQITIKNMQKE